MTQDGQSMDEILASIKRIISEEGEAATAPAASRPIEDVLELNRPIGPAQAAPPPAPSLAVSVPRTPLVSPDAAQASRQALEALSRTVVTTPGGGDNTLEGLVRELLRPLLKEWLDARLPEIVDRAVAIEIAKITGRE